MKLLIDSREQKPYTDYFDKYSYSYRITYLKVGDYSIEGYENEFAVERKTLNDFISSITFGRARFEKELERARQLKYFALIIECSLFDIENKNYNSKIEPATISATIFKWSVKYHIPIFLVEARKGGALAVIKLSEGFLKYHGDKSVT